MTNFEVSEEFSVVHSLEELPIFSCELVRVCAQAIEHCFGAACELPIHR